MGKNIYVIRMVTFHFTLCMMTKAFQKNVLEISVGHGSYPRAMTMKKWSAPATLIPKYKDCWKMDSKVTHPINCLQVYGWHLVLDSEHLVLLSVISVTHTK